MQSAMDESGFDYLPLSALQHFAYCPRQFSLIHIEQMWEENRFTAEGRVMHERVDSEQGETRKDLHIARGVRITSRRLRLTGIADVVEFHRDVNGILLPGREGYWRPFPIEYKRGREKKEEWDRLQLCAQAMALEEMLDTEVAEGALFYGRQRRRKRVIIDSSLRDRTREEAEKMHVLWKSRRTPTAKTGPKCDRCSLRECCLPGHHGASAYLNRMLDV